MREQRLINLKQSLLVIDKQIEDMGFVSVGEICHLHSVLSKLSQSKERLLKLLCFLTRFVKLLELLPVVNLILETSLHDLLAYLLYAIDEQRLKFVPLRAHVDLVGYLSLLLCFLTINDYLQVTDSVRVASLQGLHVLYDFLLDFESLHLRLENQLDELLELNVLGWNVPVA